MKQVIVYEGNEEMSSQSLIVHEREYQPTLDQQVAMWLHEKSNLSGSEDTQYTYTKAMKQFRDVLHKAGTDLDGSPGLISQLAQGWAGLAPRKGSISANTYNNRIGTLSSFYEYAILHDFLALNPMKRVAKRRHQSPDYARPIDKEDIAHRLQAIDRSTMSGLRDYAIISLAVTTGRRKSELASLHWGDISMVGNKTIVNWLHCKGGKFMMDEIEIEVRDAVLAYVRAVYGDPAALMAETPLWLVLNNVPSQTRKPLNKHALRRIWLKYLGTGKVHSTRHSFSIQMEQEGAKLSEIGARLGHSNLATTSIYLQRMHAGENPYAGKLVNAFGIRSEYVPTDEPPLVRDEQDRIAIRIKQALEDHPEMSGRAIARMLDLPEANVRYYRRKFSL